MSFKVSKIVVGKGKTTTNEKQSEWIKQYYEVEVLIEDESQIELARGSVETLLDSWLSGKSIVEEPKLKGSTKLPFDALKIQWQDRENEKGKFQVSEDYNNPEHKALLKFLNEHAGGCVNSEGWFYWVYKAGDKIGRKLRQKTSK
jgi:hypothetical protein